MDRIKLILGTSLIIGGFVINNSSFASDNEPGPTSKPAVSPSGESGQELQALRQLAGALSTGGGTWGQIHRTKIGNEESKEQLDLSVPDMNCIVDEIANYVACYGSPIANKEGAEFRFTNLIDDLNSVLPSEIWHGAETEPQIGSIRSYLSEAQDSNARIDLDIDTQRSPDGEVSYFVTIFGWAAFGPKL